MIIYQITPQPLAATASAVVDYQQTQVSSAADQAGSLLVLCSPDPTALPADWLANSDSEPRIDLQFRQLQLSLQGDRATVTGPEALQASGLAAVAGCACLRQTLRAAADLLHAVESPLLQALAAPTSRHDIAALQQAQRQTSLCALQLLALRRQLEWPQGDQQGSTMLRLRTELCMQAQFMECLVRLENELEWLHDGIADLLNSKQESARARSEAKVGLIIILLLVIDLLHSFWHG